MNKDETHLIDLIRIWLHDPDFKAYYEVGSAGYTADGAEATFLDKEKGHRYTLKLSVDTQDESPKFLKEKY